MKGYIWASASILLVTVAQLLLKWGVVQLPPLDLNLSWMTGLAARGWVPIAIFAGGLGYVFSMGCWFMALRYLPLSLAYPLLSLSYVLVYLAAVLLPWLHESASVWKSSGVILILLGVWLLHSRSPQERSAEK